MDELLQDFIAETRETLEALGGEIVAWEADPADRARLDAIFRFVHTVKGSCGFLDLPRLAALSHAAEDVLSAVRAGDRAPDASLVNAVLAIIDRIGDLVERIDAGERIDGADDEDLITALAEGSAAVATAPTIAQRVPARNVRLSVDLLDRMMNGMSEMVLARNELSRRLRDGRVDPAQEAALERLTATVAELRDTVTRTRMQTIDALFSSLPRIVRDTAASLGKSVTLAIEGADVELDREMIEVMRDPLMHIVRNAIDHGIESPAARRAAGKRESGRLVVAARQAGNQIVIEVSDDGAGIDTERLVAKMAAIGGDGRDRRALSEKAKLNLIFEPGLSSRDEVTEISGRGVGMDVVRAAIEPVGGRIELDNAPGRGLTISIHMPLTLSIIPTLVVAVGKQRFAMPRQAIEEIVRADGRAARVDRLGSARVATIRDRRLPLVDLAECLGLTVPVRRGAAMLVVVGVKGGSFAIAIDDVIDTEELVIKPAAPAVMACGMFAGQTLPDTGRPMLMLDCAGIAAASGLVFARAALVEEEAAECEAPPQALLARDLDGELRAVPLALVNRVDSVDRSAVGMSGGRPHATIDGRIVPLAMLGDPGARATLAVLRVGDGRREAGYVVAEPLDIVDIADEVVPLEGDGPMLGVMLAQGERVELVDPFWLLDPGAASPPRRGDAPLCLIDPDDPWSASFLRPLLEQAGYRVATRQDTAETTEAAAVVIGRRPEDSPHIRLRSEPCAGGEGVYRFDRRAILSAVAQRVAAGRAA